MRLSRQATVTGDFILIKNQYASRQAIVLSDDGFVFLGSRGLCIAVLHVCTPTPLALLPSCPSALLRAAASTSSSRARCTQSPLPPVCPDAMHGVRPLW